MNEVLVGLSAVLFVLLVLSVARHRIHKAEYQFTKADLLRARREAVSGSHVTKGGQIAEQLAPWLPGFCEVFNPKDARFLGNPVDFIIFDGLEEGEVRGIVLLEIKSGKRLELSPRQRQVKRVADSGLVRFETLGVPNFSSDATS